MKRKKKNKKKKTADPPHLALLDDALVSCGPIQLACSLLFAFDHVSLLFSCFGASPGVGRYRAVQDVSLLFIHSRNTLCDTNDPRSWQAGWFLFELPGCVHVRVRCYRSESLLSLSQSTVAERFSCGLFVSSNDQVMMDEEEEEEDR